MRIKVNNCRHWKLKLAVLALFWVSHSFDGAKTR